MPFKSEKIKIKGTKFDRRRKLTETQKEEIVNLYDGGDFSQRKLAKIYGVSRRLITFILDPEKERKNKELRKLNGGSKQYYDKEKHTTSVRNHRKYKEALKNEGLISLAKKNNK